ncbi:30S ribosomal protein S19 [archaeon]|jgi:small subunit ribosomal protein S19|nr:30S ribosomal protein S19 [archaeon]
MAKKEFKFHGKSLEEVKTMSLTEFGKLLPSRQRRSLQRGYTEAQKKLIYKVKRTNEGTYKKTIKTHCRDVIIVPSMLGLTILIHTGRKFEALMVVPEMLGHFLGEFALTRTRLQHSSPGIGATRSSASQSTH